MTKLNLQLFTGSVDFEGSAVKGSRIFISETLPITLEDEVMGVMETSDKGATANKVDATTLRDVTDKQALGTTGATEITLTFALSDAAFEQQTKLIKKNVFIYEESFDTSTTPDVIGNGVLLKAELGGLVITGQSVNALRQFTQDGVMTSDDYYYARVKEDGSFSYTGMNSGTVETFE
ncbi:MAG: hypothetical protein R3Y60_01875 [bacterium]